MLYKRRGTGVGWFWKRPHKIMKFNSQLNRSDHFRTIRIILKNTAMKIAGSQIHTVSLFSTVIPRRLKNLVIPIGETSMGVQGKKYLLLLKGGYPVHKRALLSARLQRTDV